MTPRYVVRESLTGNWIIFDMVADYPYSFFQHLTLGSALLTCQFVNAIHAQRTEEARCPDHGTFMPCTLNHERMEIWKE